jgi:hypothetical protein
MANPLSYAFWTGDEAAAPDSPLGYKSLLTRRKIAETLMGKRSPFPKNVGEGLTYLGESIGDIMQLRGLDEAERRQAARESAIRSGFPGYTSDGQTAAVPPPSGSTRAPASSVAVAPADSEPYTAPAVLDPNQVPLPPPRPVRDRSQQIAEVMTAPETAARLLPCHGRARCGTPQQVQQEQRIMLATA